MKGKELETHVTRGLTSFLSLYLSLFFFFSSLPQRFRDTRMRVEKVLYITAVLHKNDTEPLVLTKDAFTAASMLYENVQTASKKYGFLLGLLG